MEKFSHTYIIQRQFGYAKVLWEIENYLPETCKKDWIISSPDFSVSGHQTTKWRLYLKPKYVKDNYTVHTYLERLDPFPGAVRVKWTLSYPLGVLPAGISRVTSIFEKNTAVKTEIPGIDILENHMRSNLCDAFVIRCRMCVYSKENTRTDMPKELGLKCLSQDLAVLYKLGRCPDVTLFMGEAIFTHKAVVSIRNRVLNSEIAKLGDNVEMEFPWMKGEVARNLIAFLYTGNLDYVLRTPSATMHQLINHLEVNELKSYFTEEELFIRTSFGMKEFILERLVTDIPVAGEDCVLCHRWKLSVLNTSFQLCMHFDKETENIAISGEFIDGEIPKAAYIECVATDGNHKLLGYKHSRWTSDGTQKLKFEKFISRATLEESDSLNKVNIRIVCKLRILTTGVQSHSVIMSKNCSLVTTKENEHYEQLSKDLEFLFKTGKYSDFAVSSTVITYKVHKAILESRSHVFAKLLYDAKGETSIRLPDVDAYTLRIILSYMYTGSLKNYKLKDLPKVYAAAERFCILPLKYTCSQILQDNLRILNGSEILSLAHKGKDLKLKFATFKFFCRNVDTIQHRELWCSYIEENPPLKKEFSNFVEKFIQLGQPANLGRENILKTGDVIKSLNLLSDYR